MTLCLTQHVMRPTWSRIVAGKIKESILDLVYSNKETQEIAYLETGMSDHLLISMSITENRKTLPKEGSYFRNWKRYNNKRLLEELNKVHWNLTKLNIQAHTDCIDHHLMVALDRLHRKICQAKRPRILLVTRTDLYEKRKNDY